MYIGHVGAALAARRGRRSIGLLVLLIATYTPDWVDTGLCLAGGFSARGMLSHSIPAIALFSVLGFAAYAIATRDWRAALVVAAVIISHMVLDWITGYKPTWPGGPMIGLVLYDHPLADFAVEAAVIAVGAALYASTLPARIGDSTEDRTPAIFWRNGTLMFGALIALQLAVDLGHLVMRNLSKC